MECQVRIVGWSDAASPWTMKFLQPEGALNIQNHIGRGKEKEKTVDRMH